jgi:hypothetical protein
MADYINVSAHTPKGIYFGLGGRLLTDEVQGVLHPKTAIFDCV